MFDFGNGNQPRASQGQVDVCYTDGTEGSKCGREESKTSADGGEFFHRNRSGEMDAEALGGEVGVGEQRGRF